jgi:fructose-1-phosphate kinase PfkB-like protein
LSLSPKEELKEELAVVEESQPIDDIDVDSLEETAQKYMELLRVLYINGSVYPGENLYTFNDFSMAIEKEGIDISDKELEDFLKVCVMLKVINVDKYNRKAIMSYLDAREVISKLKD